MSDVEDDYPGVKDPARLAALRSYEVLDRPRHAVLDELTRAAAAMFDTPMSAVSLVDADRQWFAGSTGLADPQTPLDVSLCAHTVPSRQPLIVPDATVDPRFAAYRCVTDAPHVRFYAGSPIIDEDTRRYTGRVIYIDAGSSSRSPGRGATARTFARPRGAATFARSRRPTRAPAATRSIPVGVELAASSQTQLPSCQPEMSVRTRSTPVVRG